MGTGNEPGQSPATFSRCEFLLSRPKSSVLSPKSPHRENSNDSEKHQTPLAVLSLQSSSPTRLNPYRTCVLYELKTSLGDELNQRKDLRAFRRSASQRIPPNPVRWSGFSTSKLRRLWGRLVEDAPAVGGQRWQTTARAVTDFYELR